MVIIKPNVYDDFMKVKKIINSCETVDHIKVAKKVVWQFGRKHGHFSSLACDLHTYLSKATGKEAPNSGIKRAYRQLIGE